MMSRHGKPKSICLMERNVLRNVVFTVIVSFYSHIEDTNVSFLVRPFSLLGFSGIYCYLLFVL